MRAILAFLPPSRCDMHISLIAAMSENGVIGANNKLPWHLPDELAYFKKMTSGKPVIMGRKTFESMGSHPLPKRHNIILTHAPAFEALGCTVVHSPSEALRVAEGCEEVMVIGGATLYAAFLPLSSRIYLTIVHQTCKGDTYFPDVTWDQWKQITEDKKPEFTTYLFERHA